MRTRIETQHVSSPRAQVVERDGWPQDLVQPMLDAMPGWSTRHKDDGSIHCYHPAFQVFVTFTLIEEGK